MGLTPHGDRTNFETQAASIDAVLVVPAEAFEYLGTTDGPYGDRARYYTLDLSMASEASTMWMDTMPEGVIPLFRNTDIVESVENVIGSDRAVVFLYEQERDYTAALLRLKPDGDLAAGDWEPLDHEEEVLRNRSAATGEPLSSVIAEIGRTSHAAFYGAESKFDPPSPEQIGLLTDFRGGRAPSR